jgi:hypothetical protein
MIKWFALPVLLAMGCTASAGMQSSRADRAERELAKALEGRVAGEPQSCISSSFTNGPQVISDKTLLYRPVGKTVWRNDIIGSCPSLGPNETIVLEIYGGQICANDRFRVINPGVNIPSASCRLGKFVPYKKP